MAAEKRIALFAVILVAGLVGAFLFPRPPATDAPVESQEAAAINFQLPAAAPPQRMTMLTPVETPHQPTAPTASTHSTLDELPPTSTDSSLSGVPPSFRPELPRLTDEPLYGEFMEPATTVLVPSTWDKPVPNELTEDVAELVPVAPRSSVPGERVGRQTVEKPLKEHVVRDGDTLKRLAQRYLGDADRYREIYELNTSLLSNPEVLPLGAKIKIPPRQPTAPSADNAATRVPALYVPTESVEPPSRAENPLRQTAPELEPIRRGS